MDIVTRKTETERKQNKKSFDFAHLIRSVPLLCWDHRDKGGCQTTIRFSISGRQRLCVWYSTHTHTHTRTDHSDVSAISSQSADCGTGLARIKDVRNKADWTLQNRETYRKMCIDT